MIERNFSYTKGRRITAGLACSEGPVIYVHQSEELISAMDEWNTEHHNASGLIARVRELGIGEAEAEQQLLDYIASHVGERESPLCGNTIGQDRRFLARYMPRVEEYLHYRSIDVSTLKELAQRWRPDIYDGISKQSSHRALDDIRESISELKYYRDHFLRLSD
jgi:oligoribonuclease